MADFPTSIYAPRTKENRSAVVYDPTQAKRLFAEDITKLDAEIVALETFLLGLFPSALDWIEITNLSVTDVADIYSLEINYAIYLPAKGLRIPFTFTPASATAQGTKGTVCWDDSYIYVCTATNTWKRVAISTW